MLQILLAALAYVIALMGISRLTSGRADNDTFFRGERRSPWWAVAFGMLGASLSGVTFVSVPGMVHNSGMTYLQMCMGFVPGYCLVAFVLLPVYYRLRLTTIYTFLRQRFGNVSYRTGTSFFLLSKLMGASVRLYLVCVILQQMVMEPLGLPFTFTAVSILVLIWFYTRRGGIGTIVWTDCLQTLVLLVALVFIIQAILNVEGWSVDEAVQAIVQSPMSRVFELSDWTSRQHFWKQFLSGIFIVVVMTGLDQDMMQKNLTCRTLRESQLNMVTNGLLYLPVNLLFLALGVLMYGFAFRHHIPLPATGDAVLPQLCAGGYLGVGARFCFTLGIVAAAFSSADSALTALTTSVCVDMLDHPDDERLRRRVHVLTTFAVLVVILFIHSVGSHSVIDAVYTIASYTYGPLLGLFAFALLMPKSSMPSERAVPFICMIAPVMCYVLSLLTASLMNYHFGYELLLLNGSIVFCGLWLSTLLK